MFFWIIFLHIFFISSKSKFYFDENPHGRFRKIENIFRNTFNFEKFKRIENKEKIFKNILYAERSASFLLSYISSIKNNESFLESLKKNTLNESLPSIILNSLLVSCLISDANRFILFRGKKIKGYGGY